VYTISVISRPSRAGSHGPARAWGVEGAGLPRFGGLLPTLGQADRLGTNGRDLAFDRAPVAWPTLDRMDFVGVVAALSRTLDGLRGRGRIAQRMYRPNAGGDWRVRMRAGHMMAFPRAAAIGWLPAFTGKYDDPEIQLIYPYIEAGGFVVDIGACFGFYTVPLGIVARDRGALVAAVEPAIANITYLDTNIDRNGLSQAVVVVHAALGRARQAGSLQFESGSVGNAAIDDPTDSRGGGRVEQVSVLPLDELQLPPTFDGRRCSLVKLDVEGMEMSVLGGGEAFIGRHRPTIVGEFSREWLSMRGLDPSEPLPWAAAHDYRCFDIVRKRRSLATDRYDAVVTDAANGQVRASDAVLLLPTEQAHLLTGDEFRRRSAKNDVEETL
jgi:FkbM family methyltransferase